MFQIRWLWENLKGYRKLYIIALCMTVITQSMYLINPNIGRKIVDEFIYSENAAENLANHSDMLIKLLIGMVLFTLLRTVFQYTANIFYEISSQGLIYRVRTYLFDNVQKQDARFFDQNRTGDIMTRLSGDLDMVRHSVAWVLKTLVEALVLFTSSAVYFFIIDPLMAVCILALTPIIFIVSWIFKTKAGPLYQDLRDRLSGLNTAAEENISGNRVVKAFAREEYEKERFDEFNSDYSEANKKANLTWLTFYPAIEGTAQALAVVQLVAGGLFVISGRITLGEYTAISGLIWAISNPMRMIGNLVNDLQRFMASANKIVEFYYARSTIVDRADAIDCPDRLKGNIEFKNVSFKYGDTEVLHDISFTVKAGETVVIMGETGSGKTSLVNLISRCYDVSAGEVLVDGNNVRMMKLKQLRGNIGIATQDVLLYSDSIDGNIAFGDTSMSDEDVRKNAKLAAAASFIEKMPEGYDTIIGERGVGLSGGQKQRIALARALAVRPSILILDDTTSAVDMETEKYIQNSLKNLDFPCTKLIIAQRISSAENADKIIVLRDGKIEDMGTHEELISREGYYREIYDLQR